jgi:hypothetical protein
VPIEEEEEDCVAVIKSDLQGHEKYTHVIYL